MSKAGKSIKRQGSGKEIVLVLSDMHFPAHAPETFDFLSDMKKKHKPTMVVSVGDETEGAALGFHDKDPDALAAGDEYREALKCMKTLYKLFPEMQICISNHGSRLYRRAFHSGIPKDLVKNYQEVWEAPSKYTWAQRIIIDNCLYIHGDPGSGRLLGFKAMQDYRMSVIHGHVHAHGGVQYNKTPVGETFWLNTGCMIDESNSVVFGYGEKYSTRPTLGCGLVIEGTEAHFLRMK